MKNIKIAILGGGTAGAISALCSIYKKKLYEKHNVDMHIYLIHDPSIETLQVGESLSPTLLSLINVVTGYTYDKNNLKFNETLRFGTNVYWEKSNGNNFFIDYGSPGLHVDSTKFSSYLIDQLDKSNDSFTVIEDNVVKITQNSDEVEIFLKKSKSLKFDFVIDCMGFPSKEDLNSGDYLFPSNEFVNSVLVAPVFEKFNEDYTSSYVHDNGWMFGVPLSHRKAFGYCYNSKFTSYDDALKDFKTFVNFDEDNLRHIKWKQYYRKDFIDGRIIYNGNKLYFFDPNGGIPLHFYMFILLCFFDFFKNQHIYNECNNHKVPVDTIVNQFNIFYQQIIKENETSIALNYAGPSNISSKFWKETGPIARSVLLNSSSLNNWRKAFKDDKKETFFTHPGFIMENMINGYKIDLDEIFRE